MMPSPAELLYFLEVANSLNLSRASERLGISQPSLSTAMKRLEQTVGTEILIRQKRGVALTQAGKQLLAHTKQLLQYWSDAKAETLASHNEVQGSFTIGCHPTVALYYASRFMPKLLEENSKLELHLVHDISRKIVERVINLSIDIGIVINPVKHPDLIIRRIRYDEIALWTNGENKDVLDPSSKKAILIHATNLMQTQTLLSRCKKQGIHHNQIVTTENLEVIADLTANGCGIGIFPASIAAKYANLKRIPNSPTYKDEVCMVYRHENREVRAIQAITMAIKNA
jgi:DNA-binding transcriptional LysR family regulator